MWKHTLVQMLQSMWVVRAFIANPTLVDFDTHERSLTFRRDSKRYGWITVHTIEPGLSFNYKLLYIFDQCYDTLKISKSVVLVNVGAPLNRVLNDYIDQSFFNQPEQDISVMVRAVRRRLL